MIVPYRNGERLTGNPIIERLDGEARIPLLALLAEGWSEEDRAAYGVTLVEEEIQPVAFLVDIERDRRISAGAEFNGVRFQTRPTDRENVQGAYSLALAAVLNGAQPGDLYWHGEETPFVWIAEDNSLVPMDAQTCLAFGQAIATHKSALIFAAREIKDMAPIPADFRDDKYWPE